MFLQMFNTVTQSRKADHHITFVNKAGEILFGGLLDRYTINIVSDVYVNTCADHRIDGLTYFMNESGLTLIQDRNDNRIVSGAVRIWFCQDDLEANC